MAEFVTSTTLRIDPDRLRALLDAVNVYGRNPDTGGFNRIGYSDADMAVRGWFAETLAADGLAVRTDAVANVFGRFGPAGAPCIMAGSHLDTVPEGGAFDGALGVCVALECVRAIRDAGLTPSRPIEVVAFAEEEGRFGGMLGSQAVSGQVAEGWVERATDSDGMRLADALRAQGLDPAAVPRAAGRPARCAPTWSCTSSRDRRSRLPASRSASPVRSRASATSPCGWRAAPTTRARRR